MEPKEWVKVNFVYLSIHNGRESVRTNVEGCKVDVSRTVHISNSPFELLETNH